MPLNSILNEFDSKRHLIKSFSDEVEHIIVQLLIDSHIKVHQITSRIKEREKLKEKIIRKQGKYASLSDITDIAGIRIITYFTDEIDKIAAILSENFNVDFENSIDKRKLEDDRFGYMSLHYIIGPKSNSKGALKFQNLRLEIQIRSILQHGWAEIEHDLGYKGSTNLPSKAKRTFHRVAALLEVADLEFLRLRQTIENYGTEVKRKVNNTNDIILLDITSLKILIAENENMLNLDKSISKILEVRITDTIIDLDKILTKLKQIEIYTDKELIDLLNDKKNEILEYARKRKESMGSNSNITQMSRGLFLYYLVNNVLKL